MTLNITKRDLDDASPEALAWMDAITDHRTGPRVLAICFALTVKARGKYVNAWAGELARVAFGENDPATTKRVRDTLRGYLAPKGGDTTPCVVRLAPGLQGRNSPTGHALPSLSYLWMPGDPVEIPIPELILGADGAPTYDLSPFDHQRPTTTDHNNEQEAS